LVRLVIIVSYQYISFGDFPRVESRFGDIKEIIRSCKLRKDMQYNGQTKEDKLTLHIKTK
jgi:hypothetical protein